MRYKEKEKRPSLLAWAKEKNILSAEDLKSISENFREQQEQDKAVYNLLNARGKISVIITKYHKEQGYFVDDIEKKDVKDSELSLEEIQVNLMLYGVVPYVVFINEETERIIYIILVDDIRELRERATRNREKYEQLEVIFTLW